MPDFTNAIATITSIDLTLATGGVDKAPAEPPPLPIRRPCVPLRQMPNPEHLPQCASYIDGEFIGYAR